MAKLGIKGWLVILAIITIIALPVAGCAKPAPTGPVTLTMQAGYPPTSRAGYTSWPDVLNKIKERTDGQLEIKLYASGQLVKSREMFTAVSEGLVDIGNYSMQAFAGKAPICNVAGVSCFPYAADDEQWVWLEENTKYVDTINEELKDYNIRYLRAQPSGTYESAIIVRKPCPRLADFKGMKMRASGTTGKIVKALGGVPVDIAAAELYTGLQRGTVDGTLYPVYAFLDYKWYEVTDGCVRLPVAPANATTFINLDTWNKLPKEWQRIINEELANHARHLASTVVEYSRPKHEKLKAAGFNFYYWPKEDLDEATRLCVPAVDELAKLSPGCAKIIKIYKDNYPRQAKRGLLEELPVEKYWK